MPPAVGAREDRSVSSASIAAPNSKTQNLTQSAREPALAAAGVANQQQGTQPDGAATDQSASTKSITLVA
jgi:hypothetical protein